MTHLYARWQARPATPAHSDRGAVAVEYALIIAVIAVALVGALIAFGPKLSDWVGGVSFTSVGS